MIFSQSTFTYFWAQRILNRPVTTKLLDENFARAHCSVSNPLIHDAAFRPKCLDCDP